MQEVSAASNSFSDAALLMQDSVEALGGAKAPVFSLISREWALVPLSWEWVLPLWVELRFLCSSCSSRLLLLQEVDTATGSFSGAALL